METLVIWDAIALIMTSLWWSRLLFELLVIFQLGKNPLTTTGCLDLLDALTADDATLQELDLEVRHADVITENAFCIKLLALCDGNPWVTGDFHSQSDKNSEFLMLSLLSN